MFELSKLQNANAGSSLGFPPNPSVLPPGHRCPSSLPDPVFLGSGFIRRNIDCWRSRALQKVSFAILRRVTLESNLTVSPALPSPPSCAGMDSLHLAVIPPKADAGKTRAMSGLLPTNDRNPKANKRGHGDDSPGRGGLLSHPLCLGAPRRALGPILSPWDSPARRASQHRHLRASLVHAKTRQLVGKAPVVPGKAQDCFLLALACKAVKPCENGSGHHC